MATLYRLALVLGLAAVTAPALAGPGRDRLDAFLSDLDALQAQFTQVLLDENKQPIDESTGTVYLLRPGRFRWDYRAPYAQLIVADGNQVWMYEPELAQATVRPQKDLIGATPAALLTTTEPVDVRFIVEELGARDDGRAWLSLKPKDSSASFVAIRLGFGGDALQVMELEDSFGQTTRLEFREMSRNPVLDSALFAFEPPAGTDVIRGD